MAQKIAVKIYLVENMAVNNLRVCNMAKMKYKVENELPFQNTTTNVDTSQENNKRLQMNDTYTGYWHTLVINRNIQEIRPSQRKLTVFETDWLNISDICHATGMEETPKAALDIQCLW